MKCTWELPLLSLFAFQVPVFSYEITSYYEVVVSTIFTFTDPSIRYVLATETLPVSPTITPLATTLTAGTFVDSSSRLTKVSALLPSGAGVPITTSRHYFPTTSFVQFTYYNCSTTDSNYKVHQIPSFTNSGEIPSLRMPTEYLAFLTPTSVYITSTILTGVGTGLAETHALLDPADLDRTDLAAASYSGQPTLSIECERKTSIIDYREICAFDSSTRPPVPTQTPTLHCGELNPCCYGCHLWGSFGLSKDFYICEDGRQLNLNGSELPSTPRAAARGRGDEVNIYKFVGAVVLLISFLVAF